MAGTYSRVKTWAAAETLTAADLNAEFDNEITNADPDSIGDESADATEMRAVADPGESGSESLATDLKGEILRLRNVIQEITQRTYWYQTPSTDLADVIKGDGTVGRVLRLSTLTFANGTNAHTLKLTLTSVWNGDTIAEVDNVAKNATTGTYWTLNAGGTELKIESAGLSGTAIAVIGVNIRNNTSTTNFNCAGAVSGGDITITIQDADVGTDIDMAIDGGPIDTGGWFIDILYISSA
jgi:hypothetical protein